jgi:hypothetical protein
LNWERVEERTLLSPFTVTTTVDNGDNTNPVPRSLRAAVLAVNADTSNPGTDEIDFDITTGTAPFTISPPSPLPTITHPVVINGYSQPGAQANTLSNGDGATQLIQLSGPGMTSGVTGLDLATSGSTVEGLVINQFSIAINVSGNNNQIQGNFVGTDSTGTQDFWPVSTSLFNGAPYGVQVSGSSNSIGAGTAAGRNIISGFNYGVVLRDTTQSVVAGNFIGTDATGTLPRGNWVGIGLLGGATGDRIGVDPGNPSPGGGNLISANDMGIALGVGDPAPAAIDTGIYGNLIGTDVNGTNDLGNRWAGVAAIIGSRNCTIGSDSNPALGNTIAFNGGGFPAGGFPTTGNQQAVGPGVWIAPFRAAPTGISVEGNSIHDNAGLGIDIGGNYPSPGPDGPNSLTTLDGPGAGANNLQHAPALQSAEAGSSTRVTGMLASANAGPFTIDVYANDSGGTGVYGQGQFYVGSATVTPDANGQASFSIGLPAATTAGQWISATAIDGAGDTSEFSLDVLAAQASSATTIADVQTLVGLASSGGTVTVQATTSSDLDAVLQAVDGLTNPASVTVAVDLGSGTSLSSATPIAVPAGVTLDLTGTGGAALDGITVSSGSVVVGAGVSPANWTVNGGNVNVQGSATAGDFVVNGGTVTLSDGTVITGHSPALIVNGGTVILRGALARTDTASPTIVVNGGQLTVRGTTIQESGTSAQAAILVTGGTVDLGTTGDPGHDTIDVEGTGELAHAVGNTVTAYGDTFEVNGTPLGPTALSFTALGAASSSTVFGQPVTFTATVRPGAPATATPTGSVDFVDTTLGTDLGTAPLVGGVATLNTSALAAGTHVIAARYGGDGTFAFSLDRLAQTVLYHFSGFLAPLNANLAIGAGRTVPIRFQLTGYNGAYITNLSAVASLQVAPVNADGSLGTPFNPTGSGGTGLRYDSTANQFVFNWATKGLAAGSYAIVVTLADGTQQVKRLQLTAAGSSAGLLSDTSSESATATAGALLAGDVTLSVNDPNGLFTSDERARVAEAIAAVDATISPYGVTITQVGDSDSTASITLDTASTSAVGGYSDGVLGCETDSGEITIIQGWSWYSGGDPAAIGSAQYDFETVVMHELGHALGLGHSTDPTSVMCATLAAGTARRAMTAADLNVPDAGGGGASGLHAARSAMHATESLAPNGLNSVLGTGPSLSPAGPMPPLSGQWSVVGGQCPAVAGPAGSQFGPEITFVIQAMDREDEPGQLIRIFREATDVELDLDRTVRAGEPSVARTAEPLIDPEPRVIPDGTDRGDGPAGIPRVLRAGQVIDAALDERVSGGGLVLTGDGLAGAPSVVELVRRDGSAPRSDSPRVAASCPSGLAAVLLAAGWCGRSAFRRTETNPRAGRLRPMTRFSRSRPQNA